MKYGLNVIKPNNLYNVAEGLFGYVWFEMNILKFVSTRQKSES